MITKDIKLFLNDCSPKVYVYVSQFDTLWRFAFKIIRNSIEWTIPNSASAILNGIKPGCNND